MNARRRPWPRLVRLLHALIRPEYCFRPQQYRVRWRQRGHPAERAVVTLPWGLRLSLRPREYMHSQIWLHGIYDLWVTETLWRLLDAGDLAIDAGANIGYMTSIMAARVGRAGKVIASEPLPENAVILKENVGRWVLENGLDQVAVHELALGENGGLARFKVPLDPGNLGLGTLVEPLVESDSSTKAGNSGLIEVKVERLDHLIASESFVALLKIDVEGHELQVLRGAEKLLAAKRIRDIVFEEHRAYPTPVTRHLEDFGYRVYRLAGGFFGPALALASGKHSPPRGLDEPSFLATRDPVRAEKRLRKKGWHSLGNHQQSDA